LRQNYKIITIYDIFTAKKHQNLKKERGHKAPKNTPENHPYIPYLYTGSIPPARHTKVPKTPLKHPSNTPKTPLVLLQCNIPPLKHHSNHPKM
jgi:hypothetical protein